MRIVRPAIAQKMCNAARTLLALGTPGLIQGRKNVTRMRS